MEKWRETWRGKEEDKQGGEIEEGRGEAEEGGGKGEGREKEKKKQRGRERGIIVVQGYRGTVLIKACLMDLYSTQKSQEDTVTG